MDPLFSRSSIFSTCLFTQVSIRNIHHQKCQNQHIYT